MLLNIWNTVLYGPLLNALAFLVSIIPGGDVGIAVILLTILVKIALFPISQKSIESQAKMNLLNPEINKIKNSGASKEEQAKQTFELYKKYKTNPFSGCLLALVQIPLIFALYYVFLKGINLDGGFNMLFLGILDLSQKSLFLAILAGISQFFQAYFMPKPASLANAGDKTSLQESFGKSMQMQMKYIFPFLIAFIAYRVSGAVALYWITSNLFTIAQQIYANKKKEKEGILI